MQDHRRHACTQNTGLNLVCLVICCLCSLCVVSQLEAARVAWVEQQKQALLRDVVALERALDRGLSASASASASLAAPGAGQADAVTITQLDALRTNLTRLTKLPALQDFLQTLTPLSASPACLRHTEAGHAHAAETTQTLSQRIKNAYRGIHAFALQRRSSPSPSPMASPASASPGSPA